MPHITHIVHTPAPAPVATAVAVRVDRHTLGKRRWRVAAEDGRDIAVDLEAPCRDGDVLLVEDDRFYVVAQTAEAVLSITLPDSVHAAAELGWFLGNQHLPVEVRDTSILVADNAQLRALLERTGIHYYTTEAVFAPDPHSRAHHHHHHP